ncbi:hypothetical protein [Streptomyces sp. G45]|uniref:hypothetical protein n=1 Tax=Streptomyces sp. G45 TaxID=3406627 RepID=UPI003C249EBE
MNDSSTDLAADPREPVSLDGGLAGGVAAPGAGRHRGPVAEHDEEGAPRGRHRRQPSTD